ncbi:MAG: hypothetical protein AAB420_04280 [Patescibacteria group bacterium]
MDTFIHLLRKSTGIILIVAVTILTFLAILSIWEVLPSDVSLKAIGTMTLIASVALMFFAGAAVIQHDPKSQQHRFGLGWIILIILGALFILPNLFGFLFRFGGMD